MNQFGEDAWNAITQEVHKIYAGEKLPLQRAMQTYNRIFELCNSRNYYNWTIGNNKEESNGERRALRNDEFIGREVYGKLKAFTAKHVNNLYEQLNSIEQDEKFLEDYINQCDLYKHASRDLDRIFTYLNRHWIKRELEEGNKEVCEVYQLSISIWKPEMFDKILPKIIYCSANVLIAMENGSKEDKVRIGKLITAVCEIFFEYGFKFILQLMHQPEEVSLLGHENYSKNRKLFMRRLLDETDKRLRGEAPPETVLQMTDLNQPY